MCDSPNVKFLLQETAFAHLLSLKHATPTVALRKPRLACVLPVLVHKLAPALWTEGEEGLERGRPCISGGRGGFRTRELTQETGPGTGAAGSRTTSPRSEGLKRGRKWALMRMRPEVLSATCPLTAAHWKMSPE